MTFAETISRLEALGTEQTRKTYRRHGAGDNVYGVSFADLGKLKKELVGRGKDRTAAHALARQLWATGNTDARTLALLIADPQQLTETEAQAWAADIRYHPLADFLAALVAGSAFAQAQMDKWLNAPAEMLQRAGYALLAHRAIHSSSLPDSYFEPYIQRIEQVVQQAPNRAKEAMNNCLIAIGSRTAALRQRIERAAAHIGPITIDHSDTSCQTFVIPAYLERVWARKQKAAKPKNSQ
ncbi:DNA alkylation repair protein [Hymenobacter sediminicola]|uniref:DNA alkylation repair protein n=1 Tax=Hymenobacter sediminicola TaxID=2761579 RepID=A0A7G7WBS0_9BACT|nr:DNA alkylation repair protein [Hymenobacter sediminicola]QNH63813.1 DNA alkylation repair protein [Hymenobacter sediminicola]